MRSSAQSVPARTRRPTIPAHEPLISKQQQRRRSNMSEKKQTVDLGLLEEDDEFEEFPAEGKIAGIIHAASALPLSIDCPSVVVITVHLRGLAAVTQLA